MAWVLSCKSVLEVDVASMSVIVFGLGALMQERTGGGARSRKRVQRLDAACMSVMAFGLGTSMQERVAVGRRMRERN